jgi:hypothetical protein
MRVLGLALVWATVGCFTAPPAPPCAAGEWGLPRRLDELDTTADEDGPWLSADRTHVVFSVQHDGVYDVYEAARDDAASPFGTPTVHPELVADQGFGVPNDDPSPFMSEDLRTIWLGRPVFEVDRDLATATRDGPGSPFTALSPSAFDDGTDHGVDNSNNDVDPAFTPDLMTVYFASDRDVGHYRMFVAAGTAPGLDWASPIMIQAISGGSSADRGPSIHGDTLLFETSRDGGRTIFQSTHIGPGLADFDAPVEFAPTADGFSSGAPYMLPDGSAVIYSTDHRDGNGRDLYLVDHCD